MHNSAVFVIMHLKIEKKEKPKTYHSLFPNNQIFTSPAHSKLSALPNKICICLTFTLALINNYSNLQASSAVNIQSYSIFVEFGFLPTDAEIKSIWPSCPVPL